MGMDPAFAQLLQPRDWDDTGPVMTVAAVAGVAFYAVVRTLRCRNALQGIGELVRALGIAFPIAAISLLVGQLPLSAPLYAWLNGQELPLKVAGVSALVVFALATPVWIIKMGTRLHWWGSWAFPRPRRPRAAAVSRSRPTGMLLWLTGTACKVFGVVAAMWGYGNVITAAFDKSLSPHTVWFVAGAAMVPAGRAILKQAHRYLAPVLESAADLPARSYVLYLRPFAIDKDRAVVEAPVVHASPGASYLFDGLMTPDSDEQQIATTLRPIGTVVGVGAPGERLPYRGAMRMYLPGNGWQPTVAQLITDARLVVVTLATSAGTMWELAEAMRAVPAQRLLLMVPAMPQEEYQAIRTQNITDLRDTSARNPTWKNNKAPSLPGMDKSGSVPAGLIRFSEEWQPTFVRTMPRDPLSTVLGWSLSHDLRKGLRPAFVQLHAHEQRTGELYAQ
jgi:hypothetical protein